MENASFVIRNEIKREKKKLNHENFNMLNVVCGQTR